MNAADRIVFFDVETGGLDPSRHPITQFAAVAVDGEWNEHGAIEIKLRFNSATADQEALAANHYDPATWASVAVEPDRAVLSVADFLRSHATVQKESRAGKPYAVARLGAHNARFDCDFLSAWFKRHGVFCPAAIYEPLDTLALSRWVSLYAPTQPENHKLGSLCAWLGVQLDDAHDALSDVRATVQVARLLTEKLEDR